MPSKPKASREPSRMFFARPWRCEHRSKSSDIMLLVGGKWECVATTWPLPNLSPRKAAEFIVDVVNGKEQAETLLADTRATLQEVLESGLTFSTEMEAESLLKAIKERAA
jgi:hypothetical protein